MEMLSLQQLNTTELEELLMDETKKFTSSLHDGTPQAQKDILRKRIDDIVLLLEQRKTNKPGEHTAPEMNTGESTPTERSVDGNPH